MSKKSIKKLPAKKAAKKIARTKLPVKKTVKTIRKEAPISSSKLKPPVKTVATPAPKLLTRPEGHVFTVTAQDVDGNNQRQFLKGMPGDIIASLDFTFRRQDDKTFIIECVMPGGGRQPIPRPMGTLDAANRLFAELVEMENSRGETKIISQKANKQTEVAVNTQEASKAKKTKSVVLTKEVDLDNLIKNLPLKADHQIKTQEIKNPVIVTETGSAIGHQNTPQNFTIQSVNPGQANIQNNPIVIDHTIAMAQYAKSLEEDIFNCPQMRVHGGITDDELKRTLSSCLKDYTYVIKNDGAGNYVTVSHGEKVARIPADQSKFINIV